MLAGVFALSFVLLGVGSGNSGLSDFFKGIVSSDSGPNTSKLVKQTQEHPKDAQAFRELATAYQTKNETEDAINALSRYTELRPNDDEALQELAGLYQTRAQELNTKIQEIQAQQALPSRSIFDPPSNTVFGKLYADSTVLGDPIEQAASTLVSSKTSELNTDLQGALSSAVGTFKKLAARNPRDAQIQLQLGLAAEQAQDITTTIAAFKRFLKLAPDDPSAPQIRQALKQLTAPATPSKGKG
jgi:tetratricopeptide (TPR) repeat protein